MLRIAATEKLMRVAARLAAAGLGLLAVWGKGGRRLHREHRGRRKDASRASLNPHGLRNRHHEGASRRGPGRLRVSQRGPRDDGDDGIPEGRLENGGSDFLWFKSWVDGHRVATKRLRGYDGNEDASWDIDWRVKTVHFARGQTRRVRVRYRSRPFRSSEPDSTRSPA